MPASLQPIAFNYIPTTQIRLPGVFGEINSGVYNSGVVQQKALLVGQLLTTGTATPNVPVLVSSFANAQSLFGVGSMLANMCLAFFNDNNFMPLWCLPISDNGAGVKEIQTITVTGPATGAGTLSIYIAGQLVQTAVASGASASTVATALQAQIAANPNLPCIATVSAAVVTVTATHAGVTAGDIQIIPNYLGNAAGQVYPAGISVAVTQTTAGATDPDLATPLGNLGTATFDYICIPYSEATQLGEIEAVLNETTGRWSWSAEEFGIVFSCIRDAYSSLVTFGDTNNSFVVCMMGMYGSPTPSYIWAADFTAVAARSLSVDPAVPLNTLALTQVMAPQIANQFTKSQMNNLLFNGIATFTVDQANVVHIGRAITTYQSNAAGVPDQSYINVERVATLVYVVRTFRNFAASAYSRMKLLADGSPIPGGNNATTAQLIAMGFVSQYQAMASAAEVQNPATFAQNIQWYNNGNGQVQLLLPVQVADQLENIVFNVDFSW